MIRAGKPVKSLRGRFDAQRLAEYSWTNTSSTAERVLVRAKALAGDRELPPMKAQFLSEESEYVVFGRRSTPTEPASRRGSYPYEIVFVGFIIFEGRR